MIVIILISSVFLRRAQHKLENEIDEAHTTPSDYAMIVTNLPPDQDEQAVKEFFQTHVEGVEVNYVNFAYDLGDMMAELRKLNDLATQRSYVVSYQ